MNNLTTFPLELLAWQRADELNHAAANYRAVAPRRHHIRRPKLPHLPRPHWGHHNPLRPARA